MSACPYVLDDDQLPLLVFGALSLVAPGAEIENGTCSWRSRSSRPRAQPISTSSTPLTGVCGPSFAIRFAQT